MISLPREAWAAVALLLALSIFGFIDLGAVFGSVLDGIANGIADFLQSLIPSTGDIWDAVTFW
jgi:hypothetical protein